MPGFRVAFDVVDAVVGGVAGGCEGVECYDEKSSITR